MACSRPSDKESTIFTPTSDRTTTNLDFFFDLGYSFHGSDAGTGTTTATDPSDTSISTADTNPFDDLSSRSSILEGDFPCSTMDTFPSITSAMYPFSSGASSFRSTQPKPVISTVPRIQRLVHRMQPDDLMISSAQLLALENKNHNPISAFRHPLPNRPPPSSAPATPPATPKHNNRIPSSSSKTSTPASSATGSWGRMHRIDKKGSHSNSQSRSRSRPGSKPASSRIMSSATFSKQPIPPNASPSFAEWTERLRRLAVQSPIIGGTLPISPPPSTQIDQSELCPANTPSAFGLGLDLAEDPFDFSSSTTTTTTIESSGSSYPSNSTYASTIDSSSWPLSDVDIFSSSGRQDSWDFSTLTTTTPNDEGTMHPFDTTTNVGLGLGLGLSFNDDILSTSFSHSTIEPNQIIIQTPAAAKLPATPFHSPGIGSTYHSPDLSSFNTSTAPTTPSSRPSHKGGQKHKPSLSHPSNRTPPTPSRSSKKSYRRASQQSFPNKPASPTKSRPKANGGGGLGFVNYTPLDKARILTGVAPSGSSKTKARREKEAEEKRRKLSEAAKRLVSEAGGNLEGLEEVERQLVL